MVRALRALYGLRPQVNRSVTQQQTPAMLTIVIVGVLIGLTQPNTGVRDARFLRW